jgi:hypothetical protein
MSYIESEHYRLVKAYQAENPVKLNKKVYVNEDTQKIYLVMRHVFERLLQVAGPYDYYRGRAANYRKSGVPLALTYGAPQTTFDTHIIAWQEELINRGLMRPEDMMSPGSVFMALRCTTSSAKYAQKTFRMSQVVLGRRAAVNAGWLLYSDVLILEQLNFGVTISRFVTPEPDEDVIESDS